jgi:hypothetical protein
LIIGVLENKASLLFLVIVQAFLVELLDNACWNFGETLLRVEGKQFPGEV